MQKRAYWIDFLLVISIFALIFTVSLLTKSIGTTDIGDYAGVAKFFAGELHANIRSSHSYFYGFLHYPLILLTHSFFALKLVNLAYLVLIVLSAYFASRRNRKTLLLFLLSPIIWYMGPWINPVQISSLLFFWAYYFMKKYDAEKKHAFLLFSGLLAGIAWCFWDSVIFFVAALALSFLFNKKTSSAVLFVFFLAIGFLPKLAVDQIFLGSFAAGILRYMANTFGGLFLGGVYGDVGKFALFELNKLIVLLMIPFSFYKLFSKESLGESKSRAVFVVFSLCLAFVYPQIRYLLMTAPIILFEAAPKLTMPQLRVQLIASIVLTFFVIAPHIIQISHSTNAYSFETLIRNAGNIKIDNSEELIHSDLDRISIDFPGEVFVVGNEPDNYMAWSLDWWGDGIFLASIQDYRLELAGNPDLFSKTFNPKPNIQDRREIWISGGMRKNSNDKINYAAIRYGITDEDSIGLDGFKLVKKYAKLRVFEKI